MEQMFGWAKETEIGPQELDSCSLEVRQTRTSGNCPGGCEWAVWSGQSHCGECGGQAKLCSPVCDGRAWNAGRDREDTQMTERISVWSGLQAQDSEA